MVRNKSTIFNLTSQVVTGEQMNYEINFPWIISNEKKVTSKKVTKILTIEMIQIGNAFLKEVLKHE